MRFRYTDYRQAGASRKKTMTLTATEFIRRMLLHVLPPGFHRIRHYGFLANRNRQQKLTECRRLLHAPPLPEAKLTAAAYVLMQELRLRAARTACAQTQVMCGCAIGCSNSASTWSAPSAASFCTCRARRRISTRGARSPFPSGRAPGNASNASLDPRARPPSRRSCLWPALHDGQRASNCCSTTPSPVDGVIQTLVPPDSRADHTLPVVGQDPS